MWSLAQLLESARPTGYLLTPALKDQMYYYVFSPEIMISMHRVY